MNKPVTITELRRSCSKYDEISRKRYSAYNLLHGYCDITSYAIATQLLDEGHTVRLYRITQNEGDGERDVVVNFIHQYCLVDGHYFVDIRGAYTDWEKFIAEFKRHAKRKHDMEITDANTKIIDVTSSAGEMLWILNGYPEDCDEGQTISEILTEYLSEHPIAI